MDELLAEVRQTNRWLRTLALPVLRATLEAELDREELRRIYQASDGRAIREVAKSAGVGLATVQKYWQLWAGKSIVELTATEGRFARLVDLREVGLEPKDG